MIVAVSWTVAVTCVPSTVPPAWALRKPALRFVYVDTCTTVPVAPAAGLSATVATGIASVVAASPASQRPLMPRCRCLLVRAVPLARIPDSYTCSFGGRSDARLPPPTVSDRPDR